jgi:hypothetical protein
MNGMNVINFGVKKVNGKMYRINEIMEKGIEQMIGGNANTEKRVKEFKLVNLTNQIYNNDDATSEEDYSQNISFISEESDESSVLEEKIDFADVDNLIMYRDNDNNLLKKDSSTSLTRTKSFNIKWTHFISVPLYTNKEFIDKFEYFKKKILEENDIDTDLFQKSNRLHMTICLLKLDNKNQIANLDKILKELDESIKKILGQDAAMYLDFDQLEIMGTPHKSRVLYTKPSNCEKYKDIVDLIIGRLLESNILTEEMKSASHIYFSQMSQRYENEKPHATLLNSTFLKRKGASDTHFNGLKLIKRMNNFSFGVHKVDEIHLNEMRVDYKTDMYVIQNKYKLI